VEGSGWHCPQRTEETQVKHEAGNQGSQCPSKASAVWWPVEQRQNSRRADRVRRAAQLRQLVHPCSVVHRAPDISTSGGARPVTQPQTLLVRCKHVKHTACGAKLLGRELRKPMKSPRQDSLIQARDHDPGPPSINQEPDHRPASNGLRPIPAR
jgi:hypothetical protein